MEKAQWAVPLAVFLLFLFSFGYVLYRQPKPPLPRRDWLQYANLARFQLLALLLLVGFGWAAKKFAPGMLANIFVLTTFKEVAIVSFLTIIAAWICFFTLRTLARSASARLGGLKPLERPTDALGQFVTTSTFFIVAAIPLLFAVIAASWGLSWQILALGILSGWALATAIAWLHNYLVKHTADIQAWAESLTKRVPKSLTNGIFKGYFLRSGHVSATVYFIMTAAIFLSGFILYSPTGQSLLSPPAIAYLLLLFILFTWALPALSLFFDRYRVPVLLILVIFSVILTLTVRGDYYYPLQAKDAATLQNSPKSLPPIEAYRAWNNRQQDDRLPIVVVMASGGGIKAAVWTTTMLQALQRWLGYDFAEHIVLFSSVSGGSVGVLHYMDSYQAEGPPSDEGLERAVQAAIKPSLSDAIWGLTYRDLLLGGSGHRLLNRGMAMEHAWRRAMLNPDATLDTWRADVAAGWRPPVFFNSTIMDDGSLFVFTPLDERDEATKLQQGEWHSVYFNTVYTDTTVFASTAARMSATFPYASPIARPLYNAKPVEPNGYHLADGGYFDNYGIVSTLEWLAMVRNVVQPQGSALGRNVILVRIESSSLIPEDLQKNREYPERIDSLTGPPLGAIRALFTAQKWRNDQAINQLIHPTLAQPDSELVFNQVSPNLENLTIDSFTFVYTGTASLSWQLSQAETDDLRCSVELPRIYDEAKRLCAVFFPHGSEESAGCKTLPTLTELEVLKPEQC